MQENFSIMSYSRIFSLNVNKPKLSFMIFGIFMGIVSFHCAMLLEHIIRENGSSQEIKKLKYMLLLISHKYFILKSKSWNKYILSKHYTLMKTLYIMKSVWPLNKTLVCSVR